MKHFRLLSLLFGVWFLAGCTADPTSESTSSPPEPAISENSHAVPVEQALEELQSLLETIDAPTEDGVITRSSGVRQVKGVTSVSPEQLNPSGTRSETTADVEDLLYIVNFEDEAGYAILGADDRLEPVYAIMDEGSLTAEEFRYAVTATDEQAEADGKFVFPLQLVAQAALGKIENAGTGDGGIALLNDGDRHTGDLTPPKTVISTAWTPYVTKEKIGPLIPVKWGQGSPYNYCCSLVQGQRPVAGCGAIAVSQLLASNYLWSGSAPGRIKNTYIDWPMIRRGILSPKLVSPGINGPSPEGYAVAMLIAAVGCDLSTDYGLTESGVNSYNLQGTLIRLTYKDSSWKTYNTSYVQTMLRDRQKTTIASGWRKDNGEKKGHYWNLDGWFCRTRNIRTYYSDGSISLSAPYDQTLIHCNFGWEGIADGYYSSGVFNLTNGPVTTEEESDGKGSKQDKNYNIDLEVFTYTSIN